MDFNTELVNRVKWIEEVLKTRLPKEEGPYKVIMEAMNYSVAAGGKRLRPMLMKECFDLLGGDEDETPAIYDFMAALEMIHTYSLVHDDLPAMDNDEYRRGKKATHAAFGEDIGILAGDGLLNYAFEVASHALVKSPTLSNAKALSVLATKAGIYGMIGGQVLDLQAEEQEIPLEHLTLIHRLKCGALIESAMKIGALLAGADDDTVAKAESIGADIGLAFQIQDDILDVTGTEEELGKPIGSDAENAKNTYVTKIGLEASREEVRRLTDHAISTLEELGGKDTFLEELLLSLVSRRS